MDKELIKKLTNDELISQFTTVREQPLREALAVLVKLKDYKDKNGKDAFYEVHQQQAWDAARTAIAGEGEEMIPKSIAFKIADAFYAGDYLEWSQFNKKLKELTPTQTK